MHPALRSVVLRSAGWRAGAVFNVDKDENMFPAVCAHLTPLMEGFPKTWDVFHMSIWEGTHRKQKGSLGKSLGGDLTNCHIQSDYLLAAEQIGNVFRLPIGARQQLDVPESN